MQRTGQHVNYVTLKSYIESQMSGSNWSAKKAFLELIDNAFDAGATQIEIARTGDCVSITDNGCGTDVPYCIVDPHNRQDTHGGRGTGQYGIGGAFAAIFLTNSGRVEATSVHGGTQRGVVADWSSVDDATSQFPTKEIHPPRAASAQHGTQVRLYGVTRNRYGEHVKKSLVNDLGVLYKPGIMNGINIVIDGQRVSAPFTPEMVERPIRLDLTLSCGMQFTAVMGLLSPGVNASCNRVYYGPRLMEVGHDLLSDLKTNTSRLMFEVFLRPDECRKHGMKVTTTKESFQSDDVTRDLLKEMEAVIAKEFRQTLDAAAEQVLTFRLNFVTTAINNAVKAGVSATINPKPYARSNEGSGISRGDSERGQKDDFVDHQEFGCEDATAGPFSIEFKVEPTSGNAGAIAIELSGSAITIRVNKDKLMGRTQAEEISWMLDALPGLIRAKLYDAGSNRDSMIARLCESNKDWAFLLETKKRGGHGTTPMLIELFNNARLAALEMLTGKREAIAV